jgi:nucleoside-diphosphate-sugar epimerase
MEWANIAILELILKRAKVIGSTVVSLGSAAEYGNQENNLVAENAIASPISLYGKQKLIANELLHSYISNGVNAMNLRLFNVIGPNQSSKTALGDILRKMHFLKSGTNYILDDYDIVRDLINLDFVNEAINYLIEVGFTGAINIGSGRPTKLLDIVREIATRHNLEVEMGNLNPNRIKSSIADISKLKRLGLSPTKLSISEMSDIISK